MNIKIAAAGSMAALLFLAGCSSSSDEPAAETTTSAAATPSETMSEEAMTEAGTIVEVAQGAGTFETLVAAVTAADLVETLSGEGPFTVFAPTDAAFAKLPKGTVEELVKPENKQKLINILTYHVVPKKVMAKDVVKLKEAKTAQGSKVQIEVKDGKVMLDKAQVVKTDIPCKNGVIHVIDTVIIPKEKEEKS